MSASSHLSGRQWELIDQSNPYSLSRAAHFLQSQFGTDGADPTWTTESLNWKLGSQNPAGPGEMMMAHHEGEVVGTVSLVPKRLWMNGAEVIGAEVGDAYTHPEYRSDVRCASPYRGDPIDAEYVERSIFGRLASELVDRSRVRGIQIIYGTPNARALPSWTKRLGFYVPERELYRNYLRPSAGIVVSRFPSLSPIASSLAKSISVGLKLTRRMSRIRLKSYYHIDPDLPSDAEIDDLWRRCRKDFSFSIVKDSRWIRWRFLSSPHGRYEMSCLRTSRGILVGWVVMKHFLGSRGTANCYMTDWLIDAPAQTGAAFLDDIANRDAAGCGRMLIWATDSDPAIAILRKARLLIARQRGVVMFHESGRGPLQSIDKGSIGFSLASSDNG